MKETEVLHKPSSTRSSLHAKTTRSPRHVSTPAPPTNGDVEATAKMKRRVAVTVTVASGGGDFVVVDSDPRKDTYWSKALSIAHLQ
jgi:hypothetical protein